METNWCLNTEAFNCVTLGALSAFAEKPQHRKRTSAREGMQHDVSSAAIISGFVASFKSSLKWIANIVHLKASSAVHFGGHYVCAAGCNQSGNIFQILRTKPSEKLIMEQKARYNSILDRSTAITWQGDCYVYLQSTSCSPPSKTQPPALDWVQTHQDHLRRFTSAPFLHGLLLHLRKTHLLSSTEESRIKEAGRLAEQVNMLITNVCARKDSHASEAIRDFTEGSDSPAAQLIKNYDSMVKDHKENLLRCYEHRRDSSPKRNFPSRDLLLVEGLSDLQQKEHDLTQVGATRGRKRNHLRELSLNRLLEPLTRVSLPPRVSLTIGVGGIGKTTRVRDFILQWTQGSICSNVSFVLPFTFSELNFLEKLSAERLVRMAFPHLSDPGLILSSSCRTLLIFDGLDEFRCTLNFSNAPPCEDPKKEVPIEDLVTNIIRGNLLPGVALWVTSRPKAASLIPGGLVDRVTEVPGFSPNDIQVFLNHHIPESDFAHNIWTHLQCHKNLMVFCYTPYFCWVVADTMKYLLQGGVEEHLPRTCTELYAHFCCMKAESGEPRGREPLKVETLNGSNRKLLGNLGRLAFYGLLKNKYTFSEQDLRAYGIDPLLTPNSLAAGLIIRDEAVLCTTYRFTHLTLQEFLAATFYFVSSKRAIFDLFSESTMSWPKIGFHNHFKSAIQRSQQAEDGHLDVFARFLSGLLCPLSPLAGLLGKDDGSQRAWAAGFVHNLLDGGHALVSQRAVNLVYCLQEMQHAEILRAVEDDLRLGSLAGKLTRANCVVLGYLLHVSPECGEQTNLTASLNYTTVKCLLPQLLYCRHLRLESNHFKDDVMELLGSILSAKDCHIHKISLADNDIGNKGVRALSRGLMVNRTLTSLNLRNNNIGARGAKFLAEALKMNQVLLSINLQNNAIEEEGARALAEVLECSRKLVSLNIRKNGIGANGAKEIADALKMNRTLTKLTLCSNQLGDKGTASVAEALTVNHTLLSLQLQSNSISNKGMTALTKALRLNRGLVSLNLRENSIGVEGAKNMAHALHENHTLQDLDLTANLLHDEGVQAIAEAVRVNQGLTSLHLQWNFIKCSATKAMADALLSNTTMQLLDLQENAIGDEGVICLAEALKTNTSLRTLCLQGVSVGSSGAVVMAEALMTNQSLQTLDLRGNSVGMKGAKALANSLKINRSLKSLNLQENLLGMDGAIFIATALKGNHHVTYINLQGNGLGESGAKVISDAIRADAPACVVDI
ncbi:NLR family CARD domain-containing protein 3 isoform X2 [Nerophis lumbriciformis]|uniref:NLR family CARD domain-containing protein 3 isoform X2 n=1 Tax=Nerophis lumbriciformis TaxID=546530 RepID=UPI002ADFCB20|nr:NLR family CARD domain-containing protein 3 isoform X2 [Nerophis lumbriciformis]